MPTATITVTDIISRHAADIAYVAEENPATDLDGFIDQLETAASRLDTAGINGHEDLEAAATLLDEARAADEAAQGAFLKRADKRLEDVWEMTEQYREMV